MSDAMWAFAGALVTGVLTLIGVIIASRAQGKQMDTKLQVSLTEMRKDIQSLRDETKRHNGLIERTYRLETSVARLEDEDHRQNRRLEELERRSET